jgi:hypothetical protein
MPPRDAGWTADVRTLGFTGGSASGERAGDGEKVVVSDREGKMLSESGCDEGAGSYDELIALSRTALTPLGRRCG